MLLLCCWPIFSQKQSLDVEETREYTKWCVNYNCLILCHFVHVDLKYHDSKYKVIANEIFLSSNQSNRKTTSAIAIKVWSLFVILQNLNQVNHRLLSFSSGSVYFVNMQKFWFSEVSALLEDIHYHHQCKLLCCWLVAQVFVQRATKPPERLQARFKSDFTGWCHLIPTKRPLLLVLLCFFWSTDGWRFLLLLFGG